MAASAHFMNLNSSAKTAYYSEKKIINNKKVKKINMEIKANDYKSSHKKSDKFDKFHFEIMYKYYFDGVETKGKFSSKNYEVDTKDYKILFPVRNFIEEIYIYLETKKGLYKYDFGLLFEKIRELKFDFKNGEKHAIIKFNGKYAKNRETIYGACILF